MSSVEQIPQKGAKTNQERPKDHKARDDGRSWPPTPIMATLWVAGQVFA